MRDLVRDFLTWAGCTAAEPQNVTVRDTVMLCSGTRREAGGHGQPESVDDATKRCENLGIRGEIRL
jgi:hypothetical protein